MEKVEDRKMTNNMFFMNAENNVFDQSLSTLGILFIEPK